MKKNKFDFIHIIMILMIIFLLTLLLNVNSTKNEVQNQLNRANQINETQEKTINDLEQKLESDTNNIDYEIHNLSTDFIQAMSEGNHDKFFSKELYDEIFSNKSNEEDLHGHSEVDITIHNISVIRENLNNINVYGIYSSEFGTQHEVTNDNAPKMKEYYTIHVEWIKENDEYLVSDFRVQFLKDNFSDIINQLSEVNQREGENNE